MDYVEKKKYIKPSFEKLFIDARSSFTFISQDDFEGGDVPLTPFG